VRRGDRRIDLSRLEFAVMVTLARNKGAVVHHAALMREVWGADKNMGTVHTFMSYLRAKLQRGGESPLVHTVRGVGYALRSHAS
jgi:DNA-binding response OmpR family regulator